ncbi:App1 family protein [Microbacterium sp.]|uniref:App1 family protein n=1 Tax=Microbacterium sp. TaxID=51671 RepID=UPI0039E4A32E
MSRSREPAAKVLWFARLEYRFHAWRERRARARGQVPTVAAFPGYGGEDWVRVVGRVLIVPPGPRKRQRGEYASVRGWRSFAAVPVGYAQVSVTIDGVVHEVVSDRGGVVDTVLPARLAPGWQPITMAVEGSEPVSTRVFVVGADVRFGVVSDVDDTVMVTTLPRPFRAAWNSFVLDELARQPVPGMSVFLERVVRDHPGAPVVYLSTGAWNVAPTLIRFLGRHLFPPGALLLTDWGPTHDRWFRSGTAHKEENLRRLAREFPHVRWLLIGDDGQHDDALYTAFTQEFPEHVAAVAIRQLSPAEAVLVGGRTAVDDHSAAEVPWVTGSSGASLLARLRDAGILSPD